MGRRFFKRFEDPAGNHRGGTTTWRTNKARSPVAGRLLQAEMVSGLSTSLCFLLATSFTERTLSL